mmetsp:Transcript_1682/g.2009  ORF Transcript_1682/g.2009 Transcript_1682/m.2009 type:complete len:204 (+) Transcript_1682:1102-1713(+)
MHIPPLLPHDHLSQHVPRPGITPIPYTPVNRQPAVPRRRARRIGGRGRSGMTVHVGGVHRMIDPGGAVHPPRQQHIVVTTGGTRRLLLMLVVRHAGTGISAAAPDPDVHAPQPQSCVERSPRTHVQHRPHTPQRYSTHPLHHSCGCGGAPRADGHETVPYRHFVRYRGADFGGESCSPGTVARIRIQPRVRYRNWYAIRQRER